MKRVARRSKPKQVIQWRWVWGVALTVEVIAAAYTSPWTGLRSVVVVNPEQRDKEWIAKALRADRGVPILRVSADRLERTLKREPRIEKAAISRGIDGRLTVRLRYREPFARLQTAESLVDLDINGLPFRKAEGSCPYTIQLAAGKDIAVGQTSDALDAPLAVLKELHRRKLAQRAILSVDSQGAMCLNIGASAPISLGAGDRVADKLATLQTIVSRDSTLLGRAKYVDLKCPDAPAVAWKQNDSSLTPEAKKASVNESHARSEPR